MGADAPHQVGEIGLRFDVVELTSLDQGVKDCGSLAARVGTQEGPVTPSHGKRTDRSA